MMTKHAIENMLYPPKKDNKKRKTLLIVVSILLVIVILGVSFGVLIFYRTPAKIVNVSYELLGSGNATYIKINVKTEGGSLLFGACPNYNYRTYFGSGGGGGTGNMWDEVSNREYVKKIGPFGSGVEVWIVITVDTGNSIQWRELTIRINKSPATIQDKNLTIEEVSYIPRVMKLGDSIPVSAKVNGTTNETKVKISPIYCYRHGTIIMGSGSGSGSGMIIKDNDVYNATVGTDSLFGSPSSPYSGILLFRVIAFDENRATVTHSYELQIRG